MEVAPSASTGDTMSASPVIHWAARLRTAASAGNAANSGPRDGAAAQVRLEVRGVQVGQQAQPPAEHLAADLRHLGPPAPRPPLLGSAHLPCLAPMLRGAEACGEAPTWCAKQALTGTTPGSHLHGGSLVYGYQAPTAIHRAHSSSVAYCAPVDSRSAAARFQAGRAHRQNLCNEADAGTPS